MMKKLKRTLAIMLTVVLMVSATPLSEFLGIELPEWIGVPSFTVSAADYSATDAVSYAKNYWNDGVGLCAEFVSRCLKAGGITIPNKSYYSSSTKSYQNNSGTLQSWTNPYTCSAALLLYLSEKYEVITDPSNSQISVGDIVFMYSKNEDGELRWRDGHVGICIKNDTKAIYAAHNYATKSGTFSSSYPCTYVVKMGGHVHNYNAEGYEQAHPHKVYKKCSCGDWYYTGETKELSSCDECYPSIWYNIACSNDQENGKFYDSCNVTVTITPKVNDRNAYDSEISSITMYLKTPDGSVKQLPFGTNKSVSFYMRDYPAGKYVFWAKVETTYGTTEGSASNGSLSLNLSRLSWTDTNFGSEITYSRIQFEGINRYLTVTSDGNVVSSARQNNNSSNQSQIWKFIKNSDGTYTIQSVENNKVLDVSKGSYSRGANVLTYTSQGSDNQKWYLNKDSNGNYIIRAAMSNSAVLDVENAGTSNGTNVALWTYNGGDSQKVQLQYCYRVQYNANGGSNSPSTQYKDYGTTLTLNSTSPTRTGYNFLGWSTSSSATSATYAAGAKYSANADATLYAVWKANTYTVKYNANGGSGTMSNSSHTYNVAKSLSSNAFTRSGYTFLGWSTSSSATSATYTNGQSVKNLTSTNGGTVTLYAVWSKNPTYTLSYNANGGTGAPSSQSGSTKYTISSTVPSRSGYTFLGWSTSSSATSAAYKSGNNITISKNTTLYAVWKANTYTVKYNANGGSGTMSNSSHTYDVAKALSSNTFTRNGYIFLGWSTSSSATMPTYTNGQSVKNLTSTNSGTVTLYAVWRVKPPVAYTVAYNANGGNVTPSSAGVTAGSSVTLPTPTKSFTLSFDANGGYVAPAAQTVNVKCKGWSAGSSASSASYACGSLYKPSSNTTLYAVWDSSADSVIPSIEPIRSGYTFLGWSSSSSAVNPTYKIGETISVSGNTTLYAVWQKYIEPTTPNEPTIEYKSVYLNYRFGYSIETEDFEAVEYIVEDDSIVSVDSNGRVVALRPGTTDVYVYDANSDVRVVYTFSVDYAWWQWIIIMVLFGWIWY